MTARYLSSFQRDFIRLPEPVKKKFHRQLQTLLAYGITYPGLNARKMTGHDDVWEARLDIHYRFTFQTIRDLILLRRIGTHEIYRKP